MVLDSLISGVLVCFLINSSSFQVYSTLFKFEDKTWTEAFLACKNCGSRLPRISTGEQGLPYQLLDKHLQGLECFWLGATYDHANSFRDVQYPRQCCEIIWKLGNQTITKCVECVGIGTYRYVCAKDASTVTYVENNETYQTWEGASRMCSREHLDLPSKNNAGLLQILKEDGILQMWTRSVRSLNTNPDLGDDQIPGCFCRGSIQFVDCPQRLTTFCISETSTDGSTADYNFFIENFTSSTRPLNVSFPRSAMVSTTRNAEREQETIARLVQNTEMTIAVISFPQPTLMFSSSKDGDNHNLIGNGTIIGSIVGSVFVVLIIIVTVVVIRLRRRSKAREDTNSKSHINANILLEGKAVNDAYIDVDGEYSNITTSNPIQSYEQEPGTFADANKNDDSCGNIHDNLFDIPTNEKQQSTVLYSVVQKRLRTEGGHEEHDKISFGKAIQVEQNGHVYNKVKFDCNHRDRPTGNVYDKANFHREPRDEHGGNLYDKADFNRLPSEELSGNVYDKANR